MAADKTLEVLLKTNIAKEDANGEKFNNTLKKIVKTNNELNSSMSATRTGSRAADAALGVSGGGLDIGLQRGTTGAGGRGGERDFARQAQGLGGLVHLYATFAANIYAVSAAFSALQKAADFQRMEQSATRMSAVLGINLKAAANSMVNLTDGAVSLTDAIEKTNLAASAGLSTKQMTALTKVAKGASTALGRDMGDSLNRLVKGTVKLEPELLDELGILTKASEAYNKYALSIGKSADELTKYEKTQAFVNAVIEEGESKFSSLYTTVEANPYTKLQASIENLGKSSLNIINTVISPLVGFLAESPVGLAAAIGLVVGKLAKLAMPELLAGLATRVERASDALEASSKSFKSANEAVFKSFEQTVGYATISSNSKSKILKEASALRKQLNDSILTDFELTPKGEQVKYSDATTKLIADYEKKLLNYRNRLESRTDLGVKSTKDLSAVKQELSLLEDMKRSYADLANNEQIAASARGKENKATLELLKANRSIRVTELIMDGQHIAALKTSYALQAEITREKLKQIGLDRVPGVSKVGGAIGGAIGAAGTAAMGIATKLGQIGAVVAVGAAAYEGIKWALGEAKSMRDLDAAVEGASESHNMLGERIANINKLMKAGIANTEAYAKAQQLIGTSMNESANSIEAVYESFRKVQAEMYGKESPRALFTKYTEGILKLYDQDSLSTGAKAISKSITDTLATTTEQDSPRLRSALADSLKIDERDIGNIDKTTEAIRNMLTIGDVVGLQGITTIIRELGNTAQNSASEINAAATAVAEANKELKAVENKATLKNPTLAPMYEFAQKAAKGGTQGEKLGETLFGRMDVEVKNRLGKVSPVLKQFFKDAANNKDFKTVAGYSKAIEELPGAITKLPGKGDVGGATSYPKDRLRVEKSYVETLKYELALLENQQSLNDLNLTIAEQRLGLAGEEYNTLLEQQLSQKWSIEAQKYANSLAEANLKKEQAILGVKNDKNTLDKDGSIQDITDEYERQVDLITKSWKFTTLKLEDEKYINELKKSQALSDVESARAAMLQAKAGVARLGGQFGSAAKSTQGQVAALQAQYTVQQSITDTIAERAKTDKDSAAKYLESLAKQLDLAQKIYEAKRAATEEELKAFELAQGTGGIGQYLANTAKEFGYQIAEALKSAKSATSVLISGVVSGIDSSIKKLFEGIQQGNLNMQELSDFARNALSDAFRDAAAQSVQNGWKSLLSNVFPSLNDPLKMAIDQNTQAIQANTASQGGSTTGTTSADSALVVAGEKQVDAAKETSSAGKTFLKASDTMFLAGAAMMAFQGKWEQVAFMFLAQLATTLSTMAVTGGSSGGGMWGSLFSAVGGMITGSANGNIMSPYGPLKLNKYANGGIATSPQLSVFGEGDRNEAYVPLPDNRTIPVTLSGNTGGQVSIGDTTINVTVDSSGSAETTIEGNAQMAKMLGQAIKKTVQEEFINQARPGGMLYGR